MFKRVLVPLDGSEIAEIALPYAEELAIHLGSEIILLNVRGPNENPDTPEHRIYLNDKVATTELNIKNSADLPLGEKIKVRSAIIGSSGVLKHTAEEIIDFAEKENVSLIIMATHGRTGIKRWALGSTADKVARVSNHPILLIRAKTDTPENIHLDKILVPLDGSKQSESVLHYVEYLASKLKSEISLLNVVEPPYQIYPVYDGGMYYNGVSILKIPYSEEAIKPMKEVAQEYVKKVNEKLIAGGIKTNFEVRVGAPGEEIIKAEEELHPDMVLMSTHGHTGFSRWDHGSIADKILHAGITPLLLVRHQPT